MKKKIRFLITVGSYFPEKQYEQHIVLPVGGHLENIEFEFETDESGNAMNNAFDELDKRMIDMYHIWYWWWIE